MARGEICVSGGCVVTAVKLGSTWLGDHQYDRAARWLRNQSSGGKPPPAHIHAMLVAQARYLSKDDTVHQPFLIQALGQAPRKAGIVERTSKKISRALDKFGHAFRRTRRRSG